MKNPVGVNQPVTQKNQYSVNPDGEPGAVEGKASKIYEPGKSGITVGKGNGTDKKQYSKN